MTTPLSSAPEAPLVTELPYPTIIGWCIFFVGAIFYSYEFLLRILPSVMTADLMRVHHLSTEGFGYLMVIYYVVYTIMQLPVGLLIDRFGPKRLLLFASATCALGSFLFASESSVALVGVGRFFVGLGSSFGFVGVLRLASLWLPAKRFALATGMVTSLGMIGGVGGEVVLSYFIDSAGWHTALIASAWIGVGLLFVFWFIPEAHIFPHKKAESNRQLHTLLKNLTQLVRMPTIWLNGVVGGLLYVPIAIFVELWGVSYLQKAQGLTRIDAAFAVSWLMWGWVLGAPLVGWLADKTGHRHRVILSGCTLAIVTMLYILHHQFNNHASLYFALFLFGMFCSNQLLIMVMVRDTCPHAILATGLSFTNMLIMIGGMVFQPVVGILLKSYSAILINTPTSPAALTQYSHIMYIVPAAILLGMMIVVAQILCGTTKRELL